MTRITGQYAFPFDSSQRNNSTVIDTFTPPLIGTSLSYGVDSAVAPCNNFFLYANGGWRAKTVLGSVAPGHAKAVFMLDDTNRRTHVRLRSIIDSARQVASNTTDPVLKVIGTFFVSCLNAPALPARQHATALTTTTNDIETCYNQTLMSLGVAVGQAFARDLLASDAIKRMEELIANVHSATIARVRSNIWMSEDERVVAIERLNRLKMRIGMPRELVDFSSLELSEDFRQNEANIAAFANRQWLSSIGGDARERWRASLLNPNASYSPNDHAIEVPAAMFMPPFFDVAADDAINYASIGVVLAHEIFHSLTSQLRSVENPNMKINIDRFKAANSNFGTLDGWGTDGQRTFGEDIADLGGILVAYDAWQNAFRKKNEASVHTIDGYTPDQRFFLASAQIWRSKWIGTGFGGAHAAPFARVHNMIRNVPQFAKAFGCKVGDAMVVEPNQRVVIW